jgi:hypothetical protein
LKIKLLLFIKKLELRYLNKSSKHEVHLSENILSLKIKAKSLITEIEEFDPSKHEIKLVFRGKIMEDDHCLGNYFDNSNLVQVFKKFKFIPNKEEK